MMIDGKRKKGHPRKKLMDSMRFDMEKFALT